MLKNMSKEKFQSDKNILCCLNYRFKLCAQACSTYSSLARRSRVCKKGFYENSVNSLLYSNELKSTLNESCNAFNVHTCVTNEISSLWNVWRIALRRDVDRFTGWLGSINSFISNFRKQFQGQDLIDKHHNKNRGNVLETLDQVVPWEHHHSYKTLFFCWKSLENFSQISTWFPTCWHFFIIFVSFTLNFISTHKNQKHNCNLHCRHLSCLIKIHLHLSASLFLTHSDVRQFDKNDCIFQWHINRAR